MLGSSPTGAAIYLRNVMKEVWKPCHISDKYMISDLGNVKNIKSGLILKQYAKPDGYKVIRITIEGKKKVCSVHRLILFTFKPNEYFDGAIVNHKDCNKLNNSLDNLEWCSYKENAEHSVRNNLWIPLTGSNNGYSKLTEEQVLKIRDLFLEYKNYSKIAREYNVSMNNIKSIVLRKTWTHI